MVGEATPYRKLEEDGERPVTFYEKWAGGQGIDALKGYFIDNVFTLPLKPWERKGGKGVFINLVGTGHMDDAFVCEIAPRASLKPQRHLFEELVFILEGRGATVVWNEGGSKQTFEWQKGSLFAIPLNAWHQHFNGDGKNPARFIAVTDAPLVMNLFHNEDFIINNPFTFSDRFSGEDGYFGGSGTLYRDRIVETNFVSDLYAFTPFEWHDRGKGNATTFFELAQNTMGAHMSRFPAGIYKKAHRHGPGAHVLILAGKGFSLMWPEGGERVRIDWGPGSMLVPPEGWFHQHFNTGPEPAKYVALKMVSRRNKLIPGKKLSHVSIKKAGGSQIEYEDEDPAIRAMFEEECAKSGAEVRMPTVKRN